MTHCRECNSEISDVEAYCPFCGIAIERPAADSSVQSAIDEIEVGAEVESSVLSEPDMTATPSELLADTEDNGGFVDISALRDEPESAEDEIEADADESEAEVNETEAEVSGGPEKEPGKGTAKAVETDNSPAAIDGEPIEDVPIDEETDTDADVANAAQEADSSGSSVDGESKVMSEASPDDPDIGSEPEVPSLLTDDSDSVEQIEAPQLPTDIVESSGNADQVSGVAVESAVSEGGLPESKAEEDKSDGANAVVVTDSEDDSASPESEDTAAEDHPEPVQTPVILEPDEPLAEPEFEEAGAVETESISSKGEAPLPESLPLETPIPEESKQEATGGDEASSPVIAEDVVKDIPIEITSSAIVISDDEAKAESVKEAHLDSDAGIQAEAASEESEPQNQHEHDVEITAIADEVPPADSDGVENEIHSTSDPESTEKVPEESDGEAVESPGTTPNIGGVDTDGSKTPKLRPLNEGTVLNNRYEIVRKIGGGGMGAVYLASDKNLGGVLRAVKEMVQSYIEKEQQEKAIQDFKRESMLLTSLEHPAIPTIYDYFFDEKEGRFYLVMKYISGGDLAARLRSAPEGRLDEISVTQWALEVTDVLVYLHNRKPPIVYRDLKPANIMIDGNSSKIMLIDFGIARWVNKEEKGVTAVGTMGYAPPELFSGNVVPGSDIYSLGSTMFHLLTGADPQNNPLLIFDFQKHPRPRQINPNLSDQMERILMRTVEYSADSRFASAKQLRKELDQHLVNLKKGTVSFGIKETPAPLALSDQPVFCGFCGQKIVATDMFCAFCGAKQPLAQPGVQSQEYSVPQTTAKLFVEGTGDLNVPTFDLGKRENLVGRRDPMSNIFPEVDLSKFDPQTKVSRKHARIWRDGETFLLEDLGSSNGTVVNQPGSDATRLAPHQVHTLANGDRIQLGDTVLHFVLG